MKINKIIVFLTLVGLISSCSNFAQNNNVTNKSVAFENNSSVVVDTIWTQKIDKPNSYWKEKLTAEQYHIAREHGTEPPFSSPLNDNEREGIYLCVACSNPLFSSRTKFHSGTGWPSFWKPYYSKSVHVSVDNSLGMVRDELTCNRCGAHIGHVFNDGPKPTGLRYCIDGISLKFVPKSKIVQKIPGQKLKEAVFAQGCFWCMEEIFESLKGVQEVISGYAGGSTKNPTYQKVGSGSTNYAESIKVIYNLQQISYNDLLKVYFNSGDITQVNGQGLDIGKQYRSIVFYKTQKEKKQVENYIKQIQKSGKYRKKIAVEIMPFSKFYEAEAYHQNYVKLHPNEGYVRAVSIPRYRKAIKNFPELLK